MNKDKIIKDLKERNNKLENQRRQFELNYYHEQHIVEEKDEEIERLNNIIVKLEKWLKENLTKDDIKNQNHFVVVSVIGVLEKLKELKGIDEK